MGLSRLQAVFCTPLKHFYLFILLTFCLVAKAQEWQPAGGRSQGMGNASATFSDVWATMNNQAGLAFLEKVQVGVYSESAFGLKDLSRGTIAFAAPGKAGCLGLGISYFGGPAFSRQLVGLAFAKKFAKDFSGGIRLNYLKTNMGEYGSKGNIMMEAGIMYMPSKNFRIGFHAFNPNRVYFSNKLDQRLPGIVKLGLAWQVSDKVNWCFEAANDIGKKPQFRTGIEYKLDEKLAFRIGFSSQPILSSFGCTYRYRNMTIDVAASYHFVLGFIPRLGIGFDINNRVRKRKTEETK